MKRFRSNKRVFFSLMSVMVLGASLVGCSGKNKEYDTTVTVLQFSDFHGAVENVAANNNPGMEGFAAVVKEYTQKATKDHGYIVISGGDSYQGTPMSNLTQGKVVSEMMKELNSDEASKKIFDDYSKKMEPILNEAVTELPMDLNHDPATPDTDLGRAMNEMFTKITGCEVSFTNGGGIRSSLEKGTVTMGDMYTMQPFDNTIVTMEMTGEQIKAVLEHGLDPENTGKIQYYGLSVTFDPSKEAGERVVEVRVENLVGILRGFLHVRQSMRNISRFITTYIV